MLPVVCAATYKRGVEPTISPWYRLRPWGTSGGQHGILALSTVLTTMCSALGGGTRSHIKAEAGWMTAQTHEPRAYFMLHSAYMCQEDVAPNGGTAESPLSIPYPPIHL